MEFNIHVCQRNYFANIFIWVFVTNTELFYLAEVSTEIDHYGIMLGGGGI